MSYAPINIPAYVASYSGAVAGMGVSGWIVDPSQAHYERVTQIAGAFAQAFDIAWNDATQLNNLELAAITAIVSTEFSERGPELTNALFVTVANWDRSARACIALVLESDVFFAAQGINPGTPGGGGTTVLPLSNVVYVDQNGSGDAPDGSIANPYTSIGAGVAAANDIFEGGVTQVTLMVTPYNYSAEDAVETAEGSHFTIVGLGDYSTRLPDFNLGGNCIFKNCYVGNLVGITVVTTNGSEVILENSSAFAVHGEASSPALYLTVKGIAATWDPNNQNATVGQVTDAQVVLLDGGTVLANSQVCSISLLTLRNGSVFVADTLEDNRDIGVLGNSAMRVINPLTGNGVGTINVRESDFDCPSVSGYREESNFHSTRFNGQTILNFECRMDIDSYFSLHQPKIVNDVITADGGHSTEMIVSLTAGEPSCRPALPDANVVRDMSGQGKFVIPAGVLTDNRSCAIGTSESTDKQLLIVDSFAHEGFTYTLTHSGDMYVFQNAIEPGIWRATLQVISAAGGTMELFSVEPMFWNDAP